MNKAAFINCMEKSNQHILLQKQSKLKLHATFSGVQALRAFKHKSMKDIKFYFAYI